MPTWTPASLKAAIATLPPGQTAAQYATTLAAAQTAQPAQDTPIKAIKQLLLISGEWSAVVLRNRMALTATPAIDAAIHAAVLAVELVAESTQPDGLRVVETSVPAIASAFGLQLAALQAAGDISAATVAAITALQTVQVSTYIPAPTADDVTTATGIA